MAIHRKAEKAAAGRVVLRLYGDTLWRWEHQERKRLEEEREAVRRRAHEAYGQALVRRLVRSIEERKHREWLRWMWWVNHFQEELWEHELTDGNEVSI